MSPVFKFLVGLAAVCLFGAGGVYGDFLPGSRTRALVKLQAAAAEATPASWARLSIDGQMLNVAGQAPSPDALAAIRNDLGEGNLFSGPFTKIRYANASAVEAPPFVDPHQWSAELEGDIIILSGNVPSQAARDRVYENAATLFPGREISGALEIASGPVDEQDWTAAALIGLQGLAGVASGAVVIENDRISFIGAVPEGADAATVATLIKTAPSSFHVEADVTAWQTRAQDIGDVIASIEGLSEDQAPLREGERLKPEDGGNAPSENSVAEQPVEVVDCRDLVAEATEAAIVSFPPSEVDIDAPSRQRLDDLAATLIKCPEVTIGIVGHTDSSGDETANLELSLYRADAVAAYLRARGAATSQLRTRGVGEAEPIAGNDTLAGRAQNRRIEFELP